MSSAPGARVDIKVGITVASLEAEAGFRLLPRQLAIALNFR